MAKYHFISEQAEQEERTGLPLPRLTAEYGRKGLDNAVYFSGEGDVKIKDCEGSLILIDRSRKEGLNKLHIGDLAVKIPHAEREGPGEQPRVDLYELDAQYAWERMEELKRWRDPEHLEGLRELYEENEWYVTEHRLLQLEISPDGLDMKIAELEETHGALLRQRDGFPVHSHIEKIEEGWEKVMKAMKSHIRKYGSKSVKGAPKILRSGQVLISAEKIRQELSTMLDVIAPKVDMDRASKYWEFADQWADL